MFLPLFEVTFFTAWDFAQNECVSKYCNLLTLFYKNAKSDISSWVSLIEKLIDIEHLTDIDIIEDASASQLHMQEAKNVFSGIAPVVFGRGFVSEYGFNLGIWDFITSIMGIGDAYYAIVDRPDFIHACLNRLTDSTIAGIKKANDLHLHYDINNRCHCSYIYTDELLPGFGESKGPTSENCWALGLAQLFTGVSPDVMREFELPYISKMAKYFGMIYYGCCDRLDDRLDIVKKIPNVRKVSCSPWSKRKNFAENIGTDLIMSNKPSPACLASDNMDWEEVRKDLQYTVDLAKANNVNLELILKDVSTVRFCPDRLKKWENIAMEIVCK